MKICYKCKKEKENLCFNKHKRAKDGYSSHCKECRSNYFKTYYSLNKEYINQKNKNYYNENIEVIATIHSNYRQNNKAKLLLHDKVRDRRFDRRFKKSKLAAAKRKLEWNISYDDFKSSCELDCFYCNNKLENRKLSTSAALDRKDNSVGYTLSNVLPCCSICNYLRQDILTIEETIKIVELLIILRGL